MSPRIAYEQRIAAIREQASAAGSVSWANPQGVLAEVIGRSVRDWMGWQTAEDRQRNAQIAAYERQAASLAAFANNSYANRAGATPTETYGMEAAAAWYAAEVAGWRQFIAELPTKERS